MLGGSSALNGMALVATSQINADAWGELGNPGWNWETLAPYFRKSFTVTMPSEAIQKDLGLEYVSETTKGANGPIQASFPDAVEDPIAKAWIDSLKGLGYPMTGDPFSGKAFGGYTNAATIDPVTKKRSYSANAYYEPAKGRENLHVITDALVEKILFDTAAGSSPSASGVQYSKDDKVQSVKARREVILSAGTFNSPKILELSGIGSPTILEAHNIPVLVDSPGVGENFQDHPLAGLSFEVQDFINTKDDLMRRVPAALGAAMESYKSRQFGPFTIGGNYSSALLPLPDFTSESGKAELEELLKTVPPSPSPSFDNDLFAFVTKLLRSPHEASGGFFTYPAQADFQGSGSSIKTKFEENYITICVSLMHPLSRGSTHIVSSNPQDQPEIDPRYLSHPLDLELLARHTRYIDDIATSKPLVDMLKPGGKRSPGVARDLRKVPLDEVKDYVRAACKSTYHPTSTCSMMPREKGGVVDSRLKVYGAQKLRVVDASVIPIVTRGNTQASVYAVAERAADLIKEDCST